MRKEKGSSLIKLQNLGNLRVRVGFVYRIGDKWVAGSNKTNPCSRIQNRASVMDAIRYAVYNHNAKSFAMPGPTTGLVRPYPGMGST